MEPKKIFQQMPKIMADVEPISKDRKNPQQGYSFRGIDDVYEALQAILARHGVFTIPSVLSQHSEERTTKNGSALIYRVLTIQYRFYADDGSFVDAVVIGEGMDSGDKATNKAMSVAHKYCLLQAFAIPTREPKDVENDDHHLESKKATRTSGLSNASSRPGEHLARSSLPAQKEAIPSPNDSTNLSRGFDPNNKEHAAGLARILTDRNISDQLWPLIFSMMKGQGREALDEVLSSLSFS